MKVSLVTVCVWRPGDGAFLHVTVACTEVNVLVYHSTRYLGSTGREEGPYPGLKIL